LCVAPLFASIAVDTKRAPIAGDRIRAESGRDHALKETAIQLGSDAAVKKRDILLGHFTSMI
jgi:hypothetical protein